MRHTPIVQPAYAESFRCLGPACEDNCCTDWLVSVDRPAYSRLLELPPGPCRTLLDDSIQLQSPDACPGAPFATIRMLPSGVCPMLSADSLCRVHAELGQQYLWQTCAQFPRSTHTIDGLPETVLSLACPEAARVVLLAKSLFPPPNAPGHELTWEEAAPAGLRQHFWPIREFVIGLIRNRNYPLWQRLFLVGSFCRRLDAFARGEIDRGFADILDDFSRAVAARGLCSAMDSIPADLALQLEIVLRVLAHGVNSTALRPRLRQVLELFIEGIGHSRTGSIESQVSRYADAYRHFYAPFFQCRPRILENYLVNTVLRGTFPFGKALFVPGTEPEPAKEFAMLAIQFAMVKGLLIGVAGVRKRRFSAADVVRTIQTTSRQFEHNIRFLSDVCAMLTKRGLADARGLTMLLRN